MAEKSEADLVKLAFELLAERGWERFSFAELARRAELPLARVYAEVPDRPALLRLTLLDSRLLSPFGRPSLGPIPASASRPTAP